jgi:hypothetical protein
VVTLLGKLTDLEKLPCGVRIGDPKEGEEITFDRSFDLKEMTGNVRKMIAGRNVRSSMAKTIDTILESCVPMVGGIEGKALRKGAFLRGLLNGDRDFLLLKIRLVSKGNIVIATMNCPHCHEKLDVSIDLAEMDVYGFDPERPEYKVDAKGRRIFTIEGDGTSADFRYPDGHDQAAVAQMVRANPIEAQHRIYQRCLTRWEDGNGVKEEPFPTNFFDQLPIRMVDWVDDNFKDEMPGPEMDTSVTCEVCGAESQASMESSDFLFPQTRSKRSNR